MSDELSDNVQKVARVLAKQNREGPDYPKGPDYPIEVSPGFQVPRWLLYVSEARRLILERAAIIEAGGK